jgi:hypothetical protein
MHLTTALLKETTGFPGECGKSALPRSSILHFYHTGSSVDTTALFPPLQLRLPAYISIVIRIRRLCQGKAGHLCQDPHTDAGPKARTEEAAQRERAKSERARGAVCETFQSEYYKSVVIHFLTLLHVLDKRGLIRARYLVSGRVCT